MKTLAIIAFLAVTVSTALSQEQSTKVVVFSAPVNQANAVDGSCWTTSIASGRLDAFRCMVGNTIHDPCFTSGSGYVRCPEFTARGGGVTIHLTKALPQERNNGNPTAFTMTLANNVRCSVGTGTVVLNHPFYCSNGWVCGAPAIPYSAYQRDVDASEVRIPLTTVDCGKARDARTVAPHRMVAVSTIWM